MKNQKRRISAALAILTVLAPAACDHRPPQEIDTSEPANTSAVTVDTAADTAAGTAADTEAHVHAFGDWFTTEEPTCSQTGLQERACDCGETEVKTLNQTAHQKTGIPAVEPTLTENGSAGGIRCAICETVLTQPGVVPYIGHTDLDFGFSYDYAVTGRGACTAAEVYIPTYVDGLEVRSIAEQAFFGDETLTALRLPDTLAFIETAAFAFCTSLTELILPDGLMDLHPDAFYGCSGLTRVVLPDNIFTIHPSAFARCASLTDLTLPKNLGTIRLYAFEYCTSLTSLDLPEKVREIQFCAFRGCTSLTSLVLPEKVQEIQSGAFRGCTSLTEVYLPASLKTLGIDAFYECPALTDVYFAGTEAQWNDLGYTFEEGTNVTVHFNYGA